MIRYLTLNMNGILVVGSMAIVVLWMLADVHIPDRGKGVAFRVIVLVAGVMLISGALVMPA